MGGMNDTSSVLLSFRKEKSDIYTYWGEIKPMLYENEDSGEIYFQLDSGSEEREDDEKEDFYIGYRIIGAY